MHEQDNYLARRAIPLCGSHAFPSLEGSTCHASRLLVEVWLILGSWKPKSTCIMQATAQLARKRGATRKRAGLCTTGWGTGLAFTTSSPQQSRYASRGSAKSRSRRYKGLCRRSPTSLFARVQNNGRAGAMDHTKGAVRTLLEYLRAVSAVSSSLLPSFESPRSNCPRQCCDLDLRASET
jgi:hypothetical protein